MNAFAECFSGRRVGRFSITFSSSARSIFYGCCGVSVRRSKRFCMPKIPKHAQRVELDATTLAMLLDGIDVKYVQRPVAWTPPASIAPPSAERG